ncbi:unnamed protein product [Sphenostylis stenocarpa]|uniref:Protein TIC 21, chloroplastic n=1 Tax=Sphenostylis stenocarpa TaxID=92480 RepID=A0AA87B7M8_9FABA|nr:unnamed protein product [Sphenostylis stenocarpa]
MVTNYNLFVLFTKSFDRFGAVGGGSRIGGRSHGTLRARVFFFFVLVFGPSPLGSVPPTFGYHHGQRQLKDWDNDAEVVSNYQCEEGPTGKRKWTNMEAQQKTGPSYIPNLKARDYRIRKSKRRKRKRPLKANGDSPLSSSPPAMQTLLLPATRAGSFTVVPVSSSAVAAPRLSQPFLRPNSLPSLPLNLTRSSSSSSLGSSISRQPWKLPFSASASSQVSTAFTASNDESEKAKLEQVAKRLEKTARYFKRLGNLGFWGQLVCTVVAAVILSFSVVITGKVTSPATFYATAGGIVAAFISVFWSFGYIRLSEKLRKTANDPTKAPPRADVVKGLKNGIVMNLLGMGAAILGMQATVGLLVAKALTTSTNPLYQGISPGSSPVLALDVFLVQASANTILSHFLGLVFSLELLRSVTLPPSEATPFPKFA